MLNTCKITLRQVSLMLQGFFTRAAEKLYAKRKSQNADIVFLLLRGILNRFKTG